MRREPCESLRLKHDHAAAPADFPAREWLRSAFRLHLLLAFLGGWLCLPTSAIQPPADAFKHWAFQAPREVLPPQVKNMAWPKTEIDRFILAKLEANGLPPGAPSDARTLIRRMSFDMTGLPPTEEEVRRFIESYRQSRPAATAQLIDQLLASPRYGEAWGRHWLDVARYSDTKGYVYGREESRFVHAPWYRAWVIRAFNEDMPYDRFLMLQLAADQLVPAGSSDLAAMGFVTGGRRFLGVTHDIIDDRIDVVTRSTLALTVACARCHDHKYDPIPTQDYYSLYGVFHGADDRVVPLTAPDDKELAEKQRNFREKLTLRQREAEARLRARIGDYLTAQLELSSYPEEGFDELLSPDDLIPCSVRRWRDYLKQSDLAKHPIFAPWHAIADLKDLSGDEFLKAADLALSPVLVRTDLNHLVRQQFSIPLRSAKEAAQRYALLFNAADEEWNTAIGEAEKRKEPKPPGLSNPSAEQLRQFLYDADGPVMVPDSGMVNTEFFFPTTVCEDLWKLQGEVDRRMLALGVPAALTLDERKPEPNPRVFMRGRASRLGEEVPRQFIQAISAHGRDPFRRGNGRLELARAIASAENPLTARVMVNRIWQHHFGSGLVKTPSDFGLRSEMPSHPELLDWLARRFVAEGWSVKAMHRLILSSMVYQQAPASVSMTAASPAATLDPENRLLSHAPTHRLSFEQIRDGMLAVSGQLDLSMSVQSAGLLDATNKRRTVYSFVDRQFLPGTFRTFDFANPDLHVAVRHETTVPQQALFYMNGPFAAGCAKALAQRVSERTPKERVQELHQLLYQRKATSLELRIALQFISAAGADSPKPSSVEKSVQWQYGYGEYDEAAGRVKLFTPLPKFTGTSWQGSEVLPGGASGWAMLTADGGHPGNTREFACIRRWIAPRDITVNISGILKHEPEQGDGVRGFIVSSRHGALKQASVYKSQEDMSAEQVVVKAGDTIDFIVDIGGTLSYDQFLWSPVLQSSGARWDAKTDFAGPDPTLLLLTPWEQYAQVLLLSNEFAFAD